MAALQIVLIIMAIISMTCFFLSFRVKHRNPGYMISVAMVAVCDIVCCMILGSKTINQARTGIIVYYICCAWMYFCIMWMIAYMGRYRRFRLYMIPVGLISLYQTILIISNAFGSRIFSVSKHIFWGRTWWVAEQAKVYSFAFCFSAYRYLVYVSTVILLGVMIAGCVHSAKIFRGKFYALIIMQVLFTVLDIWVSVNSYPIWITSLVMNAICIVGFYLVNYHSNKNLRDWSIMNFANEMSDGFILYNEYDDLLHMNDLVKNTLSEELLADFKDKEKLDEWVSQTFTIEGMEVIVCSGQKDDVYFRAKKTVIGDDSYHLGTIYILHDTTESILKLSAMEEANRELERAGKMKSDFLANMSHEIRTPMNAVIGMAEIAMREELSPTVRDYLLQIQNSGRNLLNIINDILDFSKIEAGKMEIIMDRYEPLSEMNDIANVLMTRIGEKHLELFVTCDNNIPHALNGDAMRIRQILINLANNAIKFTQEGIVHIRMLCEQIAEDEVMLTYHVIDTGSGIKQEDLDKLFVSFQQVDSKRNRSVEGTGLGLAISQRLCEAMGGSIGVTSEFGKGSDFYFSIPQKIVDPTLDIVVDQAEAKHAIVLNEDPGMVGMFIDEMKMLGVDGEVIRSLEDYRPSGKKDYLFFEAPKYGEELRAFLDDHPDCIGIILVEFASDFKVDRPNLRIMRRPETTLSMVMTLNDREILHRTEDSSTSFKIDFIAPEAKILIVDDNAINITIAEGLLQPIQAKCYSALSGKDAVEMIRHESFDVILMDHMMPEMDGIETTHVIRETIPEAAETPIIALTANVLEGVKEMFMKEGMNDFIAKPIDIRDLIAKLKKWIPEGKIIKGDIIQEIGESHEETIVRYEGLDCEKAIQGLGSPSLFDKIVKEYYRSGRDRYEKIREAYTIEDWSDYTIKVHALKSNSRQIGADKLGEMAEQLEFAGKALDIDTIHSKHDAALKEFDALLDRLAPYFPEEEEADIDRPAIGKEAFEEYLQRLTDACDDLDNDEMEAIEEELKAYSYPEQMQSTMQELYLAIEDIDIDNCLLLIETLKEQTI